MGLIESLSAKERSHWLVVIGAIELDNCYHRKIVGVALSEVNFYGRYMTIISSNPCATMPDIIFMVIRWAEQIHRLLKLLYPGIRSLHMTTSLIDGSPLKNKTILRTPVTLLKGLQCEPILIEYDQLFRDQMK